MMHFDLKKITITISSLLLFLPADSFAQNDSDFIVPRLNINNSDINIDGFVDESIWQGLPVLDRLLVISPDTLAEPVYRTEIRAFYNDDGIYIAAINHQPADTLVARLSARDAMVRRDTFGVSIDPSGSGLYGYNMRVHLGGSISDRTILPERQMSREWDGPWHSATQDIDGGWSTEMFIPWSMMSLPAADGQSRQIGLYFERTVAHLNQNWSWPALPNTAPQHLSAYAKFQIQDVSPRSQIILYPYASSSYDNVTGRLENRIGTDIYWRPNSNTQISATFNPDFGTVESDNIVVNLGAFETFNSEKRTFFLEGNEIFNAHPRSTGGRTPLTMLNTRRIGAAADYNFPSGFRYSATERNRPTNLLGAAKATGQLGALRYGVMVAAEDDSSLRGKTADGQVLTVNAKGNDFLVGRLLYENTTGGGRRSMGWMGTHLSHPDRNATANGIDAHYFSSNGKWELDGQLLHSNVNDVTGMGLLADVNFNPSQGITHSVTGTYLDTELDLNDSGFMRRNDEISLDYAFSISRSGFEKYRTRETGIRLVNQWNTSGRPVQIGVFSNQEYTFYDNSTLAFDLRYFSPQVDDRSSRGNGEFRIPSRMAASASWRSDRSRPVSFMFELGNSQEDLKRSNIGSKVGIVWQPIDRLFLENEISYNDRESLLVRGTPGTMTAFSADEWSTRLNASYFITSRQQFRLSMQWTGVKAHEDKHYRINQNELTSLRRIAKPTLHSEDFSVSRLSFQARYQWEIAPLSDLFIVYTRGSNLDPKFEGSFTNMFEEAWMNRMADTLVIKLRYRLSG
jgi:hypothetical protein